MADAVIENPGFIEPCHPESRLYRVRDLLFF
jgi:hypothetical protein